MPNIQIGPQGHRYTATHTHAEHFATQTFSELKKQNLAPNPINFTLIFETLAQIDPDFAQQISDVIANDLMDDETAATLFTQLWSKLIREQIPSEEVAVILKEMMDAINDWLHSSNDNMTKVSAEVERLADEKDCSVIMSCLHNSIVPLLQSAHQQTRTLKQNVQKISLEVTQLKRELERATSIANTDELTNVPNRRGFNQYIKKLIEEANEQTSTFSMLLVDIDHFKGINDDYGHLVGDSILRYLAKLFSNETKGKDFIARIGGEEFVVLLPQTTYDDAVKVANKIRDKVAKNPLQVRNQEKKLNITVSIGVGFYQLGEPVDSLFERADQSLYLAKNRGRNQVRGEWEL